MPWRPLPRARYRSSSAAMGSSAGSAERSSVETSRLEVIPGGRGNDFARVVGISDEPAEAVAVLAADRRRRIDVGEANGKRFLCIASCGFDSDANRIANEARLVKGPLVYAYAALRALIQWKPAHFDLSLDGARSRVCGYSVAVANSKAYGGGMFVAPDAELDDGLFDVVTTGDVTKRNFLVNLPKVFKGTHIDEPEGDRPAGGDRRDQRRSPLRRLRRRRALDGPAGERHRAQQRARADRPGTGMSAPRTPILGGSRLFEAKVRAAKAIGELSRHTGRGGGNDTSRPGAAAHRSRRDPRARHAPPRRAHDHQRDQRQDDDRRNARGDPPRRRPRAGPQSRGVEHGVGRRDCPARAGGRRGPVRGRRGLAAGGLRPALPHVARARATSSATSSTTTASSSTSLTSGRVIAAREGQTDYVLNADDPLIADLGRDRNLRRREGVTLFGIEDPAQAIGELQHAFDAKHCRRCGSALPLRTCLRRPSRPLHVPQLRRGPS